jgi:hypothetical protein
MGGGKGGGIKGDRRSACPLFPPRVSVSTAAPAMRDTIRGGQVSVSDDRQAGWEMRRARRSILDLDQRRRVRRDHDCVGSYWVRSTAPSRSFIRCASGDTRGYGWVFSAPAAPRLDRFGNHRRGTSGGLDYPSSDGELRGPQGADSAVLISNTTRPHYRDVNSFQTETSAFKNKDEFHS